MPLITVPGVGGAPPYVMRGRSADTTTAATDGSRRLIGDDVVPSAEHAAGLEETDEHVVGCIPNYRNRIAEMAKFFKEEYPQQYDELVIELTPEQKANTRLYYTATHDFRYELLSPNLVKIFLSGHKKKYAGGTMHYKFDHLRKYHDAILKCADIAGKQLPSNYRSEMKAYLLLLKKEKTEANAKGQTENKEADPINFSLYEYLCQWAIESGNIFLWTFTVVQWNMMGRSINVDPLGFHNLSRAGGSDNLMFLFDSNKRDKTGENTTPKTCYGNPDNPLVCILLSMGCYFCIFQDMFCRASDSIFRRNGKKGSAADTYCKQLRELIKDPTRQSIIATCGCRLDHFHAHGTRKGSATHVTTATTEPAPMPSVMLRGEWSMGTILDTYWKWSQLGDMYLGRCLAGFDPDSEDFGMFPPHFREGMENEYIHEAMMLCFGPILEWWGGKFAIQGILLLMLASMVWQSDWLMEFIDKDAGHPFQNIPILQDPDLLSKLKELVTLEPCNDVKNVSGVPRHTKLLKKISGILGVCEENRRAISDLIRDIPRIVKDSVNEVAAQAGQVTVPFVLEQLERATNSIATTMDTTIKESIQDALRDMLPAGASGKSYTLHFLVFKINIMSSIMICCIDFPTQ